MLIVVILYFIVLVLKQVNVMAIILLMSKTSKCSGSCNNINDPYAKICVSDVVKNLNVKVFNPISRTNETRHIKWHETCKCESR